MTEPTDLEVVWQLAERRGEVITRVRRLVDQWESGQTVGLIRSQVVEQLRAALIPTEVAAELESGPDAPVEAKRVLDTEGGR
jgi:hypothetical protein